MKLAGGRCKGAYSLYYKMVQNVSEGIEGSKTSHV